MGINNNRNRSPRCTGSTILVAALLLAGGCFAPRTTGDVTGTVSIDGVPAADGSIAFFPVDGKSPTSGTTIKDGKYEAEVPLGTVKVQIRVSKVVGQKKLYDTPDSPVQPLMKEILPAKYNDETELTLDVKPGDNEMNFELSTQP